MYVSYFTFSSRRPHLLPTTTGLTLSRLRRSERTIAYAVRFLFLFVRVRWEVRLILSEHDEEIHITPRVAVCVHLSVCGVITLRATH